LAKPKAAMARLVLLDSAAAEVAFFLALSLVPFVGIAIALVSRWFPVGLSASIGKVLHNVLPASLPSRARCCVDLRVHDESYSRSDFGVLTSAAGLEAAPGADRTRHALSSSRLALILRAPRGADRTTS
jgi:hypothetical protein